MDTPVAGTIGGESIDTGKNALEWVFDFLTRAYTGNETVFWVIVGLMVLWTLCFTAIKMANRSTEK